MAAQIGQQAQRRYELAQEITAVAGAHQNTYSAVEHMNYLRQQHPKWSEEMREARVRSAVGQMHFLAGFDKSGVVAPEEGKANRFNPTYGVIPDQLERFMSRPQGYTDLRALSPYTLEEQVKAHAVTWLDRQILRPGHEMEQTPGGAVAQAIEQRKSWLIEQGYAHRTADGKNIAYEHGALQHLAATEQQAHLQGAANEYGKPARMLEAGQVVEGVYRGSRVAHEGAYGVVETADAVHLAKTNRGLSHLHVGKTVEMNRDGRDLRSRELTLPELGRSRFRDRDMELGL